MAAEDYLFGMDDDAWGDEPTSGPFFHHSRGEQALNKAAIAFSEAVHPPKMKARRKTVQPVWTTGQGEQMLVSEMEDDHLRNTIAYIRRKAGEWEVTRRQILNERNRDLGEYRINNALGSQWLTLLLEEFTERGLDVQ